MRKPIIFLTIMLLNSSLFAQEETLFLSCGVCTKYCDEFGDLEGMPNRLIVIDNLPKSSTNGETKGKVFGVGANWYNWMDAVVIYDPRRIFIEYKLPGEGTLLGSDKMRDFTIERSTMSYDDPEDACSVKSKEELENTAKKITEILMQQNKL